MLGKFLPADIADPDPVLADATSVAMVILSVSALISRLLGVTTVPSDTAVSLSPPSITALTPYLYSVHGTPVKLT